MKQLQELFNKHYTSINNLEYMGLYNDMEEGYISMLYDIELEELLNYFIHVNINDIEAAIYNGTLSFYKCNSDYIAVLEA